MTFASNVSRKCAPERAPPDTFVNVQSRLAIELDLGRRGRAYGSRLELSNMTTEAITIDDNEGRALVSHVLRVCLPFHHMFESTVKQQTFCNASVEPSV